MKVKLLIARASSIGSQNCGDEIEVTDAEAVRMIEAGQAAPVRQSKAPEKAVRRSKAEKGIRLMYPSVTAIRRTVPPASSVIYLEEAKRHLRIESNYEDEDILELIREAEDMVDGEGMLGRAMLTQTWAQWVPQSPGWVRLSMGPFQSLVSVEYYDADGALQTATLADFETRLSGDFVICKPKEDREWPTADDRLDAIKITYQAGFGDNPSDVPAGIRRAIKMIVANWYENREATTDLKLMDVPMAVEMLIGNERAGWYG